jgi:hypothetical protein
VPTGASRTNRAENLVIESRVVELRRMGLSFDAIAPQVGLGSRASAYKAWARAMRRGPKKVIELERNRMLDELDAQLIRLHTSLRQPHYVVSQAGNVVMAPPDGETGEIKPLVDEGAKLAIEMMILRNMERRTKFLGADAPPRVRIEVVEIDQVLEAVAALESEQARLALQRANGGYGLPELPPGESINGSRN